jgi:hypothetical protein
VQAGIGKARAAFPQHLAHVGETWIDDRLDFRLTILGRPLSDMLQVADDHALALLAERTRPLIEREGQLMLEKK